MSSKAARTSRLQVARWLLAIAIFGSTMAIGAVHIFVLAAVSVVLAAAAVLTWWRVDPLRVRRSASLVVWVSAALIAWTCVSIVPLPLRWLAVLSPYAADIWSRSLTPLGLPGPALATLSLDPGATRVQVLRGIVYLLTFLAASRISARREGVVFLERALCVTAVALALAAIVHPALGAEKVFGLYTPRSDPNLRHVAPILNPNVLAEYLNIGLALLLGQLLAPRAVWPRSLLASLAVALIAVQIWVASRGGVLAMALTVVLVVWMSRSKVAEVRGVLPRILVPSLIAAVGLGAAVLASSEAAIGELATTETSKLDLSRAAFRIVPHFALFGVGRGAFESVFPAYRTDPTFIIYTYPENFIAQWVTEWGLPAALAILVLFLALTPSTALARSPRAAGAWTALVCVAAQNLVDFGSEYPAVVIGLTTCAGIVTGGTSGTDEPAIIDVWARRPARLVPVMVLATVLGLVLALPTFGHDLFEDRLSLHQAALEPALSRREFDARAKMALLRHPAEPYLAFTGALRGARTNDGTLIPWLERVLDRALVYGPAHLLLARWLTPRAPSQARLEYRLTMEQSPELFSYVSDAIPALVHGYDDAIEVLPKDKNRLLFVDLLARTLRVRLPATAVRLDALAFSMDPNDRGAIEHAAEDALADATAPDFSPWCAGVERVSCLDEALGKANALVRVAPGECVGHATRARMLVLAGTSSSGLKELRAAAESVTDRTRCFEALADLAISVGSVDMVSQALDRISHAGCADPSECVNNLEFVSEHEVARKNPRSGLAALQRARALAPQDDGILEQIARLASNAEMHGDALKSYQALAARHPGDSRWSAAVESEKLLLLKGSLP